MQASSTAQEASGGYATRRGHMPQLSISDPSHHVTEAIGHMYDDDYDKRDSRRLSYISSPLSESISIIPPNRSSPGPSPQTLQVQGHLDAGHRHANGQTRTSAAGTMSLDSSPASPGSTSSATSDTATTSFPLNDIDYESDPAAVAQELSNLAAIRRMSMDVTATGDPDLPSYGSNFSVPSIAPSPSADENDTSRLFWVPARLHPELAPKEFKSFLESKAEHIKRRSGDFSLLSPERQGSDGSLRRKRSMLSRQIDSPQGYMDGAERLERQKSQRQGSQSPNLQQLENLVDDSKQILDGVQKLGISVDEDRPILPPAPPGHSLRRSTRTQYRKAGSLRKGERPYPKRGNRASETSETLESIVRSADDKQPILGLTRVSTDPTPSVTRAQALAKAHDPIQTSSSPSSTSDPTLDASQLTKEESYESVSTSAPRQPRQWHSRISSNGRSTLITQPSEQKIPEIIETPPSEANVLPSISSSQSSLNLGWESSYDSSIQASGSVVHDQNVTGRPSNSRTRGKDPASTLNDLASSLHSTSGNNTRTDSLSFIPTASEDRKSESKRSKDKKESEGGRKSSWHWFLGSEDKEKDKDKDKKRDKESDSRRLKSKIVDKVHETTHSLPTSNDVNQKGRESAVFDRLDPKLEEERRKDNARRSSGESKKEKESGLFSSIFGGGRKKHSGEHHHKKSLSRTLSPDPPVRELKPDIDYPWTRFSILEERAIYRMAHIKLANPRRALYSQVLLSNFMYSYLAKVQQMHPTMMLATSATQRQQKNREQPDEYLQYQRYQEAQEQQYYGDSSYDDPQMYEYNDDPHNHYQQHSQGDNKHHAYENGNAYGPGHYQNGPMTFGDDVQLDDDDDDMW